MELKNLPIFFLTAWLSVEHQSVLVLCHRIVLAHCSMICSDQALMSTKYPRVIFTQQKKVFRWSKPNSVSVLEDGGGNLALQMS